MPIIQPNARKYKLSSLFGNILFMNEEKIYVDTFYIQDI
jgi:hypothetical protein